jgi:preprotein translocase subunit SecF
MSETHKPFRELIKPNSNFEFVEKRKTWATISTLAIIACIAMLFVNNSTRGDYLNWTIDFKGGTELIFAFEDAEGQPKKVSAAFQSIGPEARTKRRSPDHVAFKTPGSANLVAKSALIFFCSSLLTAPNSGVRTIMP